MIIETINKEWRWLGISAVEVIDENDFDDLPDEALIELKIE